MDCPPIIRIALIVCATLLFAACGSGGESDATPVAAPTSTSVPTAPPEPSPPPPDPTPTPEPQPACPVATGSDEAPPAGRLLDTDYDAGGLVEGIAVDHAGNVFATLAPLGELVRLSAGSTEYESFGSIPGWGDVDGAGLLGLAIDGDGHIYAAAQSVGSSGVWRFDCVTAEATLIAGSDEIYFANSLTFDDDGVLYVSDSFSGMDGDQALGAIWRITPEGDVEKWFEDAALGGNGAFGFRDPLGINGLAWHDQTLYAALTETNSVASVAVLADGTPGPVTIIAEGVDLFAPDGIAVSNEGEIYVAGIGLSAVVQVNADGTSVAIAEGAEAGLDLPASLTFGTTPGTTSTLFVSNLALVPELGTGLGPGITVVETSDAAG